MTAKISSFKGEYEFLSNFYRVDVELDGQRYPSVEHAFQAAKTEDSTQRAWIYMARDAGEAKRRGRKVTLRDGWDGMRIEVMLDLLRQKFDVPALRLLLAVTGDAVLEEGNWWGDRFWGTVRGEGENWLGLLLMHVRKEVVKGEPITIVLKPRGYDW